MKKKVIVILLFLMIGAGLHAQQFSSEADFTWAVSGNGVIITGFTGTTTIVNIPPQIQGMPVLSIGPAAFHQRGLTVVAIPNSVTSIGEMAFADNQLTSVTIPPEVTTIGYRAFYGNMLSVVIVPFNTVSIGDGAFGAASIFRPDWSPIAVGAPPPQVQPPVVQAPPQEEPEPAVQVPPQIGPAPIARQAVNRHAFGFRLGGAFGLWAGLESGSGQVMNYFYQYDESNRFSFNFALYYVHMFTNSMALQAELNFLINQGIEGEWSVRTGPHGTRTRLSSEWTYTSIDIPVLFRFRLFQELFGFATGHFLAGPHISIPIAGDNVDDAVMTYGLTIGGTGYFQMGPGHLVGDMRFITDFNGAFDGASARRQVLSITMGYQWTFAPRQREQQRPHDILHHEDPVLEEYPEI